MQREGLLAPTPPTTDSCSTCSPAIQASESPCRRDSSMCLPTSPRACPVSSAQWWFASPTAPVAAPTSRSAIGLSNMCLPRSFPLHRVSGGRIRGLADDQRTCLCCVCVQICEAVSNSSLGENGCSRTPGGVRTRTLLQRVWSQMSQEGPAFTVRGLSRSISVLSVHVPLPTSSNPLHI